MDEILQCLGWPLKDPLMLRCWGGRWCETLWIMYYLSTGDEMNHQPVIFFCRFWENCNGEQRWIFTKHVPAGIGVDGLGGTAGGLDHRSVFDAQNRGMVFRQHFVKSVLARDISTPGHSQAVEQKPHVLPKKGRLFGKTMELCMDKWLDAMVNAQVASSLDLYQKIGGLSGSSWCFKAEWHHDFIWFFDSQNQGFWIEARRLASENALVRVSVDLWREVPSQQYGGTQLAAGSSSRMVDVSTVMRWIQVIHYEQKDAADLLREGMYRLCFVKKRNVEHLQDKA